MKPSEVIEMLVNSDLYEPRKLPDIQDFGYDPYDFVSRPFLCHILKFEKLTHYGIDQDYAIQIINLIETYLNPEYTISSKCKVRLGSNSEITSKDIYQEWDIFIKTLKERGL